MKGVNDILSDSIDILSIAVESQINYIRNLNKLYRIASIIFIAYTFVLGMTLGLLLNGNGTKLEVMLFYLISIFIEAYILLTITLLKLEARKDAFDVLDKLDAEAVLERMELEE